MDKDLWISRGDTQPISFYIVDEVGQAVDLTGATAVLYGIRDTSFYGQTWPMDAATPDTGQIDGSTLTIDSDQTSNRGKVSWTPVVADSEAAGTLAAQVKVTFSGGGIRHYPQRLGDRVIHVGTGLP